ncbi:MAG TPA: DNA alkylation repair protein [Thermoplasmata archaeon]|nr:DNA alkylation repair protein [Thermoplasmata archaeon]
MRALGPGSPNEWLRGYLGSPVPVLGVRTPPFRRVVREAAHRLESWPRADRWRVVQRLWNGPLYEERAAAIELLGRPPFVDDEGAWSRAARWVDEATGWALSDSLAAGPVATLVASRPERFEEILRWTRAENLWRRRASTYALRAWVRSGELDRPFRLLERLLDDPERWVQRAVGTWLRECWKKDPVRTEAFLRRRVSRLAPVTITVATERAPARLREELRAAARARRQGSAGRRGL